MELEVHVDSSSSVRHDGRCPRYRMGALAWGTPFWCMPSD